MCGETGNDDDGERSCGPLQMYQAVIRASCVRAITVFAQLASCFFPEYVVASHELTVRGVPSIEDQLCELRFRFYAHAFTDFGAMQHLPLTLLPRGNILP